MFEPGHLHRASLPGQLDFAVDLSTRCATTPKEGQMVHFRMEGQIAGRAFKDEFELHRDTAFNFASVISRGGQAWFPDQSLADHARSR